MNRSRGIDPAIAILKERAPSDELDYGFVIDCLKGYASPRVKLHHLLKIGALLRIKKGIYVLGKQFAREPYSKEVLANKIYGPSYVSLEWALQHYQLIPERVDLVTSVTWKRKKQFNTPIGLFTYDHLPLKAFAIGIEQLTFSPYQKALIATREKALADTVALRRGRCQSRVEMERILFEDLRIESEDLETFEVAQLEQLQVARPHSSLQQLIKVVRGVQS